MDDGFGIYFCVDVGGSCTVEVRATGSYFLCIALKRLLLCADLTAADTQREGRVKVNRERGRRLTREKEKIRK